MQNFKLTNDKDREFYQQDFSNINSLLSRIRESLLKNTPLNIDGLDLDSVISYNPAETLVYVTLFQQGQKYIRYGAKRATLTETLNRIIEMLRQNKNFYNYNLANPDECRIMIEYIIDRKKINLQSLNSNIFNENRFEIGVDGIEAHTPGQSYYYMPTDGISLSQLGLNQVLQTLAKRTPIGKITNKKSERLKLLWNAKNYEFYMFKSRAFVTYKDTCIPLYRGNELYKEFNYDILGEQIIKSIDWIMDNMLPDGRFLYYYDCCDDNLKDHEHPTRPENNLYYNDLRHCGGIISLIRAYQITKEEKYIDAAKKAINWSISILKSHETPWGKAYYAFYNKKAKLGGTGVLLTAVMQYRINTEDKTYDKYIEGMVCHLLSRVTEDGEMLGYYINPNYHNGEPLINLTAEEREATFSFYYPGEALLGLGLFSNNYKDNPALRETTRNITMKALDWIVNERPKVYANLFTALPSDAWLMQAIEEWIKDEDFCKEDFINFVLTDANTMMEKMYKKDDSPYIDYEGGYYYEYGDHFYPDGARSEGLIASYYLAKYLKKEELAEKILAACKLAAKNQFSLFNSERNNYSHKNPKKSLNSIRFKATRQWVRVDSIQHVSCFFARLFMAKDL